MEFRPVSEPVQTFAQTMQKKLNANLHKGGWHYESLQSLVSYLKKEVLELEEAIQTGQLESICNEAADVANFAMMIHDNRRKDR